jgi:hypothetical protein
MPSDPTLGRADPYAVIIRKGVTMRKLGAKKLRLSRETVACLEGELPRVLGGTGYSYRRGCLQPTTYSNQIGCTISCASYCDWC